uniref:PLD phosphodiesterase domain-containing protein n=1 Tax=Xiphophorus couchianus TaxID=32473 RepID=A0A3B5KZ67_9TELE
DMLFSDDSAFHLPLSTGLNSLLDKARVAVEIVSPVWFLSPSDYVSSFYPAAGQVKQDKFSDTLHRTGCRVLLFLFFFSPPNFAGAEVHKVNMTALTGGFLESSFWVVDRKHFYIGSASMDWRSLTTVIKELGVVVYDCKPLALDLHKVFSLYWGLQHKTFIPTFWSKRLFPFFSKGKPGSLLVNQTKVETYISSSPDVFTTKDRSSDLEAISAVIQQARHFIYISIIDYLPVDSFASVPRYWSRIDGLLREALILRNVHVRLLISCWEETHPLTFNFIWSLKSLCMDSCICAVRSLYNCVGMNHNRFMVTDKAVYIGNLDWVGKEFTYNAGAGLVISHPANVTERNSTVVEQLQAVFKRDWFSRYANTIQTNKIPVCSNIIHKICSITFMKSLQKNFTTILLLVKKIK